MTGRATLIAAALAAAACAGAAGHGRGAGRGEMSRAERAYLADGDADRAESILRAGIADAPGDAEARFLLADLLDALGRPEEALDQYLLVLGLARADGRYADVATAAAAAVVAMRERVASFGARFAAYADGALGRPGALPAEAVWELRNLRFAVALRGDGTPEERRALLDATGCLTRWDVIGPFGPRAHESLDRLPGIAPWFPSAGEWPAGAGLGPGRPAAPAWEERAERCLVRTFAPGARAPGVGLARTVVGLERAGTILFRLETDASVRVYAGGVGIFSADRREGWLPRYAWFAAGLPEGNTGIAIAVAHPEAAPSFSLSAIRADDGAPVALHGPRVVPSSKGGKGGALPWAVDLPGRGTGDPEPGSATAVLARLRAAIWRRDDPAARRELARLGERGGGGSPAAIAAGAQAALADPDQPLDVAFEAARALMARALEREPRLWEARLLLARAEAGDGRPEAAIALVREGRELCPREPALAERLVELYAEAGYAAEAEAAARGLSGALPGSCAAIERELAVGAGGLPPGARLDLAGRLAACDRTSDALARALLEGQRYGEAVAEYARLAKRDPGDPALARGAARAAVAAGEEGDAVGTARVALSLAPGSEERGLALADALAAAGDRDGALAVLRDPAGGAAAGEGARRIDALSALEGRGPYESLRVDGLEAIAAYRASAPRYDTGSVWVLDRTVHVVDGDGSRTEITHTIAAILSAGAISERGEIEAPEGAVLLTARAVKPDGSVRSPERVEGKPGASLRDLAIGDFVEVEYALRSPPSPVFPGGFDTGRFFFRGFGAAFHRSEMVLVVPEGMPLGIDPRGGAPEPEEAVYAGLRVLTWRARGGLPLPEEPLEPDPAERLPSVRATSGATRQALCGHVRELLADADRPSPEIRALAQEILSGAGGGERGRLAAVYRWVTENVVEDGELGGPVSHVVARRAGSRARAFLALARAAGLEGRLAFVRPVGADDTPTEVADPAVTGRVAVLAGGDWVSFEADAAPWGYLPPELRRRPALLPDRCELSETTGGAVPRNERRASVTVRIGAGGEATAEVEETLTGADAIAWRAAMRGMTPAEREREFAESYVSPVAPGATVAGLVVAGLDDGEAPLSLSYALSLPGFARADGGALRGRLPFASALLRNVGGRSDRRTPIALAVHDREEISITVVPPEGATISTRAADGIAESRWGRAERRTARRGGGLEVALSMEVDAGRIAPADYPAFAGFAAAADALFSVEVEAGR